MNRNPNQQKINRRMAQKVTITGALINMALGVAKIIIGVFASSHSLIVDGIHSFSDLLSDLFIIFVNRFSYEAPDKNHPYGHGRIETMGTLVIGCILIITSGVLFYENILPFITQKGFVIPKYPVAIGALISVLANEWLFRYTKKTAEIIGSQLLLANAWHSRTDCISSIIVLLGFVLSLFDIYWADHAAALIISLMIGKVGLDFIKDSTTELVDSSLNPEETKKYLERIMAIPEIEDAHNLRARKMGPRIILDVNIQVAAKISVSEGHEIATQAIKSIMDNDPKVSDVVVHTDVEDDVEIPFSSYKETVLPLRQKVLERIRQNLDQEIISKIKETRLHYLGKKIHYEFVLDVQNMNDEELLETIKKSVRELSYSGRIQFLFTRP